MPIPTTSFDPEEAVELVLAQVRPLGSERVALSEAAGRVLAEPLAARIDQPRFRKAAVDGYGVATSDGRGPFTETGSIAAGDEVDPDAPLGLGMQETVRIMTGAVVPPDVVRIVRFEFAERDSRGGVREAKTDAHTNIALAGENIRAGEPLLSPRRLSPLDIGILASQGIAEVPVIRRPIVTVLSTGAELRDPTVESIPPWSIYDSNSYQLVALANAVLARAENRGILGDDQRVITEAFRAALDASDVVIASGGVSMGDLDLVPAAIAEIGATAHFHGLAMKPGKPTLFATLGSKLIFGLPGSPVSTAAQFEMLIAPALSALQGLAYEPREAWLPIATSFSRRNADRHEYLPGYCRDQSIHPIRYKGSGHLSALADAELLFRIDRGVHEVSPGDEVYVRFIRPSDRLSEDFGHRQV